MTAGRAVATADVAAFETHSGIHLIGPLPEAGSAGERGRTLNVPDSTEMSPVTGDRPALRITGDVVPDMPAHWATAASESKTRPVRMN